MTVVTSRSDFERLIVLRLGEAKLLMDQNQDWDGAYYLAGYAVEFALKIRIINQLMKSDSFPAKNLANDFYKHDLKTLSKATGLFTELDNESSAINPHWVIVKDWTEQSRYEIGRTERVAKDLYDAIENEVLP